MAFEQPQYTRKNGISRWIKQERGACEDGEPAATCFSFKSFLDLIFRKCVSEYNIPNLLKKNSQESYNT